MNPLDFSKISVFKTPEDSPGFLLWRVSALWRKAIESALKPLGLTHPQFVVLATVGWLTRTGEEATQADIGRQAGIDPNTTSQILRALQTKKLIERLQIRDERGKYPSLTTAGAHLLSKALPAVEVADENFFSLINLKRGFLKNLKELSRS